MWVEKVNKIAEAYSHLTKALATNYLTSGNKGKTELNAAVNLCIMSNVLLFWAKLRMKLRSAM